MNRILNMNALTFELAGIVFIIILGGILHFTFEWSGSNPAVGVFSAVNESVWEHLKLAFWPTVAFALIEYRLLKIQGNNFAFAKTASAYIMTAIIPIIFYSYTAFTVESILAVDLASFVVAVAVGQLVSYKLLIHTKLGAKVSMLSLILLIILAVAFVFFTFNPPPVLIFQDPVSGGYGI